jgi:hydrogenase maturation protein HypF
LPSAIADEVAPGLDDLGVMVPTTPLHIELVRDPQMPPLVMTSGNLSEEPLCRGNREAVDRLHGIADSFLLHDRDIVRRVDDSVVRASSDGPIMVRRARGWVPEPVLLPEDSTAVVVATGGHLQVTSCVTQGRQAFPSQHVGDLDSGPARAFLAEVIEGLLDFLQVEPSLIACDAHPDYPSSWLAEELALAHGIAVMPIQHHVAHVAAVLGEHDAFPGDGERAIGIALDGTGWGPDHTAWGGEWLEIDGEVAWRRLAHMEPLALVGGEAAVREPWRIAVAALVAAGEEQLIARTPLADLVAGERLQKVVALASGGDWPRASGRVESSKRRAHCSASPASTVGKARRRPCWKRRLEGNLPRHRGRVSRWRVARRCRFYRLHTCWAKRRAGWLPGKTGPRWPQVSTPHSVALRETSHGGSRPARMLLR